MVTGTDGPVIYYKWKGIYCERAKGNTGRQAPVAKQQAGILGQASAISARIRNSLKHLLPVTPGRELMYRLNNAIQQWLRTGQANTAEPVSEIPFLKNFSFSANKTNDDFHVSMPVSRTAGNNLILHIPAFDSPNPVHPLPFNGQISLNIMVVCCNLHDTTDTRTYQREINIDYNGIAIPAQDLLLPVETKRGCLTVISLSVNKQAAGIVGAMYN